MPLDPITVYTPDSVWRDPHRFFSEMWRDLLKSHELAWSLFVRDIKSQYRQSVLGYVWVFLPPIAMTLTFVLLKSQQVFQIGDTSIPYPAYVLVGTLLWQNFVDAMRSPLRMVTQSRDILIKINFPREALVLAGVGTVFFAVLVRLILLVPVFFFYRVELGPSTLLFPIGLLGGCCLGLTFGILLTPVGVLYKDIDNALNIVVGFWFLLTPVVYPPAKEGLMAALAKFNPASPVILTARDWMFSQPAAYAAGFYWITAIAFVFLLFGWFVYRVALPHLIARLGM